jgi:hypothetical protein
VSICKLELKIHSCNKRSHAAEAKILKCRSRRVEAEMKVSGAEVVAGAVGKANNTPNHTSPIVNDWWCKMKGSDEDKVCGCPVAWL